MIPQLYHIGVGSRIVTGDSSALRYGRVPIPILDLGLHHRKRYKNKRPMMCDKRCGNIMKSSSC
eukprot:768065-Ditylum_brightwellii.AAC.1